MADEKEMMDRVIGEENCVLCAANSYTEKYYYNPSFDAVPDSIKEELKKIMVTLAEESGGIASAAFREGDGVLMIHSYADDSDFYYDEINAGMRVRQVEKEYEEMLTALSNLYRLMYMDLPPLEDV